ncbi:cytochrome P450 CYP82D47-like [Tripterygium wilfordii]|uniref:cytochrome P450 CYP82D47-like n=1 Tax=Tripterygium wilfordii TaxID=458696 RepID=UPI0018F848E6|nr:cytochrome P450 CYP82D47-like [Tripterygium wilfordii]
MEFLLSLPTNTIAPKIFAVLLLFIGLRIFTNVLKPKKSKTSPPLAGGAWPLLGHLHLLRGPQQPYIILGKMADKYGPIFKIKLGVHRTLIVSNSEIAKECLTTQDKVLAGRPTTVAMEIMGYKRALFGFCPYGPYWRLTRKLTTSELLSTQRLEALKHIKESEVMTAMKDVYQSWADRKTESDKVLVDMSRVFGDISSNVMFRIVVGKVYSRKGQRDLKWKQVLIDFFKLMGHFGVGDALPFLRWLDLGGVEKSMKRISKELDNYVEEWMEEHKRKRLSRGDGIVDEDFMDVMLSVLDDQMEESTGYTAHITNKATCLSIILAGSDTTRTTLTWALSLLLNNPDVLKRTQQELQLHVGKERLVNISDMKSLVYFQAVLKETLRLYPPGPLSIPHESMEDCVVAGYHVPAGTRILFNLWKIQQDPDIWKNPSEFKPERFLTTHKDVDVKGRHFELLPFGSGRRMCPGIPFAFQVMELALANMLHGFDFSTPNGEPIDMTEENGLVTLRATPLEALISPRLPGHLYMECI